MGDRILNQDFEDPEVHPYRQTLHAVLCHHDQEGGQAAEGLLKGPSEG